MKKIILFLLLSVVAYAGGDKFPSPVYLTPYGVALKPYSSVYTAFQLPASGYFGFGTTVGTLGYGIRDNGGTIEFKGSGGVWTAIPDATGSAGGFTNLSGSTKIYNTTAGNALHIRTAAGDTALTGMVNVYGILNVKNSGGTETATLGSEALTNPSFVDSTAWTFGKGWRTSTTAGSVTHVVDSTETLTQSISVVNGTVYQVTVTMTRTAGSITFQLGSLDIAYSGITATSTKTFTAGAVTPLTFTVTPTADFAGSFTEISIKTITAGGVTSLTNYYNAAGTLSSELRTNVTLTNQFFGLGSGRSNTTGTYNTANGTQSLYSNTTGTYNTANGTQSLYLNTTGTSNTANGMQSLYSNTTGSSNTANGMYSLYLNTTGTHNTANGMQSLYSNTTGTYNTANGTQSLYSNTTGSSNTANGMYSLRLNTTGSSNTANGMQSLYLNTTGTYNTANGMNSLYSNTTGTYNTANGMYSLYSNTTGSSNTANGYQAGRYITNGSSANATGSTSIFVGNTTKAKADGETNQIVIGDTLTGKGSNTVTIGNSLTTDVYLSSDSGAIVHGGTFMVNGTPITVPDYVFEDSYKQNSITEMRDFYLTNKHLPTMPSGKEVNSKAIDIMQYSMKLLETLEVQAKYISELELRISALEKK